MLRMARLIFVTLSMYVVTHLFVFAVLPAAILILYIAPERIPGLKRWFVRCLFAIVGKELEVTGEENVEAGCSYVIIANYPSFYAAFALAGTFTHAWIVAHAFVKRVPFLGQVLRRLGAIFVQPGRSGEGVRALDRSLSSLAVVPSLTILPEGQRTPDGLIRGFKRGFIRILRQTPLDLLPVTLNGMYQLKPVGRLYADPAAKPEMVIHAPLRNSEARRMSDAELLLFAETTIASSYTP